MKNTRILRLCLIAVLTVGLAPSGADAQALGGPLITEAFADAETATLTFNGAGFPEGFPVVTLGNNELPVRWAAEASVAVWLPELRPGTYRLIARWPDGSQADFYLTLGAVGAAGPEGPRGLPGPGGGAHFRDPPAAAEAEDAAAETALALPPPVGTTRYGTNALRNLTTGIRNSAFGLDGLLEVTSGGSNTAVGWRALAGLRTGSGNTAIGSTAMQGAGAGVRNNTAVGRDALRHTLGSSNIAIGRNAARDGAGSGNIFIGDNVRNRTGENNIYIGSGLLGKPLSEAQEHEPTLGETRTIRLGNWATHRYTYLVGQVYYGNPPTELAVAIGNAGAPAMRAVEALATRVNGIDTRLQALEPAPAP